jgi:5S rRNA maturation endonuclease (ribonuclease M5)
MIATEGSTKAEAYVQSKGWDYTESNGQLITTCPFCYKEKHFYINKESGLNDCKVCGHTGNLNQLMEKQGDKIQGVMSLQDWATPKLAPLPNVDKLHERLLQDDDALEYLAERGFAMAVVKQMKLGLEEFDNKRWLVYPMFRKGHLVNAKWRTLPPADKDFRNVTGREMPLYNEDVITQDMEELFFVEGEADTIACLSNGITNVVGVPGANVAKAEWITWLDKANVKKVYILYDSDQVGQKAAHSLAERIGLDKCFNIVLPDFPHPTVVGKSGKDINEWFQSGRTLAEFEELKKNARPFDVAGVSGLVEALDELELEISGKGTKPTFDTPWPSLTKKVGGFEPGDLVGVMAEGKVGKTTMVLNWLDYYAKNGIPSLLYCQEMPIKRLARKWVSYVTLTDDSPDNSLVTVQTIQQAKALATGYPADLLFGYTHGHKPDHVFEVIRQAVRRYGVRVVGFDNLQLLSRNIHNPTAELNVLGKRFKELAMELKIVIILIIQPNRPREGEIIAARNAMGSSSIEKDVDFMICLHRNRVAKIRQEQFTGFLDTDDNFEPNLLCRVDLSRYSSGGVCTLFMEGQYSLVREMNDAEFRVAQQMNMANGIQVEA